MRMRRTGRDLEKLAQKITEAARPRVQVEQLWQRKLKAELQQAVQPGESALLGEVATNSEI